MSEQAPVAAAQAPLLAYNKKDWEAVRAAVTRGFVYDEVGTQRYMQGVDELLEAWRGWAAAYPDSRISFENTFVDGGTVILEVTFRGMHTGPLRLPSGEIPATGRAVEIRACLVFEIEGSKAKSARNYFDMMTQLQQLGVGS